jgi:hypothetical protein
MAEWFTWFNFCGRCTERPLEAGAVLRTLSADLPYCSGCGRYGSWAGEPDWLYVRLPAELLDEEECDCWTLYGRVQHNNGGHYHYALWRLL